MPPIWERSSAPNEQTGKGADIYEQIVIVHGGAQGTGVLLGPSLVLTAGHVVGRGQPVRAGALGGTGVQECTVLWRRLDKHCDAALLLARKPLLDDSGVRRLTAVRWGAPGGFSVRPGCEVVGFPDVQREGARPDTEQFVGTLKPASAALRGRYVIDGIHHPPQASSEGSPWRGMSGAPVLLDGHLIGLAVEDPRGWSHGRLEAMPARVLLEDEEFTELVREATGQPPELVVLEAAPGAVRAEADAAAAEWLRVTDAHARDFGLHPVRSESGLPSTVPYVPRDFDGELDERCREAAQAGGLVLLTGDSAAGKSRSAFESMKRVLADRLVCLPDPASDLGPVLGACRTDEAGRVIWLDDLEGHLHGKGLTPQLLRALGRSRTIIVATMRSHLVARLEHAQSGALPGEPEHGPLAALRVIRQAERVAVGRQWSQEERAAALLMGDPRLVEAVAAGQEHGVAEVLAAGPQLSVLWQGAYRGTDGHPRGASLVAAAVALARTGLAGGLPAATIEELHHRFLARAGGPAARPEPLDEGWAWATETQLGISSLLIPRGDGCWRPFDYLVSEVERTAAMPLDDEVWEAALACAEGPNRSLVAWSAHAAGRADIAEKALRAGAEAGDAEALLGLVALLLQSEQAARRRDEAKEWLTRAAEDGDGRAMFSLGALLAEEGAADRAREWLEQALGAGEVRALRLLGDLAENAEDEETAAGLWERGTELGDTECAVRYGRWLRQTQAWNGAHTSWLQRAADNGLASAAMVFSGIAAYAQELDIANAYLMSAFQSSVEAATVGDPDGMITLGTILARAGDAEAAEHWWRKAGRRMPMIGPDWCILKAPPGAPGLRMLAVGTETAARIPEERLRELMGLLWQEDCQYCGRPLEDGVPALRVFEAESGWAQADINHLGTCKFPDWVDTDGTRSDKRSGLVFQLGASTRATTWIARVVGSRPEALAGGGPVAPYVFMVNQGLETVGLLREGAEGPWRVAPVPIGEDCGLTPLTEPPGDVGPVVVLTAEEVTVSLMVEVWSAPVEPSVAAAIHRHGGLHVLVTSGLGPRTATIEGLRYAAVSPDAVHAWAGLAAGSVWSPPLQEPVPVGVREERGPIWRRLFGPRRPSA